MPERTEPMRRNDKDAPYDGYYDTINPIDADTEKSPFDKERIKKAVLVLCLGAAFITACVIFMK